MTTRRVATNEKFDKGLIASDGTVEAVAIGDVEVYELWRAGVAGREAPLDAAWALDPPPGGHVFRISIFPPAAPGEEPWMHRTDTIDYALILEGELTLITDSGETLLRPGDVVVQQAANHGWINRTDTPVRMVVILIDQEGGMSANSPHLEMYRRMLQIRRFEEAAVDLMAKGEIAGGLHTTPGQEAAIVGACMALADTDYMVGTHRSHGHPIGKGAGLDRLMAELMARATGVNQGKGGSMHLSDFSVGSLGETSIVGSGFPVATGAALGAKMQKNGRVALCFFGDGASSEGTFHESLNIASIWKLPVIYFCENNGYAISTPSHETISVPDIAIRAAGYAMPGEVVDGQDVLAVHAVTARAVARARAGEGPTLIEAKTYRFNEHAAGLNHLAYRSEEEIDRWRRRDPIPLFRTRLLAEELLAAAAIEAVDGEVEAEVAAAVLFARDSPLPDPSGAFDHVFVDPILPLDYRAEATA